MECKRTMKRLKLKIPVATIIFGAAALTGCNKDNPSNNQWGAETLPFKVDISTEVLLKKVGGGDYSMEYMYDDQVATVTGTLYDMSGNVWEYCNDWYADLADLPADQGPDYAGPVSGEKIAGCGGCYSSESYTCTSAYHGREKEHNGRDATLGFRIVLR